jgi:hypothetical protein
MADYSTKQIIDYAYDDEGVEFRKALYGAIHDKVAAAIESKKQEIAENLLGLNDEQSEEQEELAIEEDLDEAEGPGAKWKQGYSASGHPAGYKHKSGEVGPLGGTYTYDYDEIKKPVQKYRDVPDTLAGRKSIKQLSVSTAGTPYKNPKTGVNKFKDQIRTGMKRHHGPVGVLPEEFDEEVEKLEEMDDHQKHFDNGYEHGRSSANDAGFKEKAKSIKKDMLADNPHKKGTPEHKAWHEGASEGHQDALDLDM